MEKVSVEDVSFNMNSFCFATLASPVLFPFSTIFKEWIRIDPKESLMIHQLFSWESKVPPPKATPPRNKALIRPY